MDHFLLHTKMTGHTSGDLSTRRGFIIVSSTKQKLNTRSSTETEIIVVNHYMPFVLGTINWLDDKRYGVFRALSIKTIKVLLFWGK